MQCCPNKHIDLVGIVALDTHLWRVLPGQKWQQARDIFEQMKAARFKPDMSTYTALLAAYHPANKWRQALQVT